MNRSSETGLDWYQGKRVLVTGASGFLAYNLVQSLAKVDCAITRLSRSGRFPEIPRGAVRARDLTGDLCESDYWRGVLAGIDVVFHFAAQTSAYRANENPVEDWRGNVQPMLGLLETCRQGGLHTAVIFASTVTITGLVERLPVNEGHADNPITVYDLHKQMAEAYLQYHVRQGTVSGGSLRLPNVYGPGPASSSSDRGIINQMTGKALRGEPLTVYGTGDQLRDYLFVDDCISAFLLAGIHHLSLGGGHFVIGTERGTSIMEAMRVIASRVAAKSGKRVPIQQIPPPPHLLAIESRNFIADSARFREITGWHPTQELVQGVDRTIQSML